MCYVPCLLLISWETVKSSFHFIDVETESSISKVSHQFQIPCLFYYYMSSWDLRNFLISFSSII